VVGLSCTASDCCSRDASGHVLNESDRPITGCHKSRVEQCMLVTNKQLTWWTAIAGCGGGYSLSVVSISGTHSRAGNAVIFIDCTTGVLSRTVVSVVYRWWELVQCDLSIDLSAGQADFMGMWLIRVILQSDCGHENFVHVDNTPADLGQNHAYCSPDFTVRQTVVYTYELWYE